MGRIRALTDSQLFEAHFLVKEKLKSTRDVSTHFLKKGVRISYAAVSTWVNKLAADMETDANLRQSYVDFKAGRSGIKVFFGKNESGQYYSQYPTVQRYIDRALSELSGDAWQDVLQADEHIWRYLNYKDPENWTREDLNKFLAYGKNRRGQPLTPHNKVSFVTRARAVAPILKDIDGLTTPHKKTLRKTTTINKSPVFTADYFQIIRDRRISTANILVFRLQTVLGCREGHVPNEPSSLLGLNWEKYNPERDTLDVYESKAVGWWNNCPLGIFDKDFPADFKQHWINRGSPRSGLIFEGTYKDLIEIYEEIRLLHNLPDYFTPHFARKTHVNILAELDYSLELIAGDPWAHEGTLGVGWKTIDVLREYYLAISPDKLGKERGKADDNLKRFYS